MWLAKFIKSLTKNTETQAKPIKKTIKDLDYLDTIWVKEDDIIFEGWVFDFTRRSIIVVYGEDLRDFKFRLEKSQDSTKIEQNGKILYSSKPED